MRRRWGDRLMFWRRIWDYCPECGRNGTERGEAINWGTYWRGIADDRGVVAYARGILVDRLLREAAYAGAIMRADCERIASEIEAGENGPPLEVRQLAACELRRLADIAPATVERSDDEGSQLVWECRQCGSTTRAIHEDQSVSCDDCGAMDGGAS